MIESHMDDQFQNYGTKASGDHTTLKEMKVTFYTDELQTIRKFIIVSKLNIWFMAYYHQNPQWQCNTLLPIQEENNNFNVLNIRLTIVGQTSTVNNYYR